MVTGNKHISCWCAGCRYFRLFVFFFCRLSDRKSRGACYVFFFFNPDRSWTLRHSALFTPKPRPVASHTCGFLSRSWHQCSLKHRGGGDNIVPFHTEFNKCWMGKSAARDRGFHPSWGWSKGHGGRCGSWLLLCSEKTTMWGFLFFFFLTLRTHGQSVYGWF